MGLFLLGFFLTLGVGGLLILAFRVITAVIGTVLGILTLLAAAVYAVLSPSSPSPDGAPEA